MDLSCLIPTCQRPDKLVRCVSGLITQRCEGVRYEILIGIDGPDRGEADAVAAAMASAGLNEVPVRLFVCDRAGPAATRNRLIEHARGSVLLFLNDDVRPDRDLIATHAHEQSLLRASGRQAMILGSAPWVVPQSDSLFDRLIRETSMVFFYDQMGTTNPLAADPDHDWGFRHAWTLNLSVPAAAVRDVGGFDACLNAPCFEDLEFAFRLSRNHRLPVLYRPAAIVQHDHRYQPRAYLDRERLLGEHSFRLASMAPECARAVFGRNLLDPLETEYAKTFVERERHDAMRLEERFVRLANIPSDALPANDTDHGRELVALLYQQHLLLKRWWWRCGLLQAAGSAARETSLA